MKKRSKLEVIKDILLVIRMKNGRIKPTHILYKSNLSYVMMGEYLSELIEKKMIVEEKKEHGRTYRITENGQRFLDEYSKISEFTKSFGLE